MVLPTLDGGQAGGLAQEGGQIADRHEIMSQPPVMKCGIRAAGVLD